MQDPRPSKYQVLFVGPPSTTAAALTALLAEQGYAVQTAVDDESAISGICHAVPDLIVLDVDRTDGGGYAFCSRQ
jgi:CheY-like chemotaxis protein